MDVNLISFKFQSDSINTCGVLDFHRRRVPLNSNLILLILFAAFADIAIPTSFKFQSDSINTIRIQPVSDSLFQL